jgi:hypothetical protein
MTGDIIDQIAAALDGGICDLVLTTGMATITAPDVSIDDADKVVNVLRSHWLGDRAPRNINITGPTTVASVLIDEVIAVEVRGGTLPCIVRRDL